MLGWVITCHDDRAQEILDALEKKHGALLQCRAVNFWRGLILIQIMFEDERRIFLLLVPKTTHLRPTQFDNTLAKL